MSEQLSGYNDETEEGPKDKLTTLRGQKKEILRKMSETPEESDKAAYDMLYEELCKVDSQIAKLEESFPAE